MNLIEILHTLNLSFPMGPFRFDANFEAEQLQERKSEKITKKVIFRMKIKHFKKLYKNFICTYS